VDVRTSDRRTAGGTLENRRHPDGQHPLAAVALGLEIRYRTKGYRRHASRIGPIQLGYCGISRIHLTGTSRRDLQYDNVGKMRGVERTVEANCTFGIWWGGQEREGRNHKASSCGGARLPPTYQYVHAIARAVQWNLAVCGMQHIGTSTYLRTMNLQRKKGFPRFLCPPPVAHYRQRPVYFLASRYRSRLIVSAQQLSRR